MRVNFQVINQKDVPALQSGTILPPAGQKGRIFYNSAGVGMYIDNGLAWLAISTGASDPELTVAQIGVGSGSNLLTSSNELTFDGNSFAVGTQETSTLFTSANNHRVLLGDINNNSNINSFSILPDVEKSLLTSKYNAVGSGFITPLATLHVSGSFKISDNPLQTASIDFANSMFTNMASSTPVDNALIIKIDDEQYCINLYAMP